MAWWDRSAGITTEQKRALIAFSKDPVLFAEVLLKIKLRKWQRVFLKNIQANRRVSVRSANGVGKTRAIAIAIVWALVTQEEIRLALISTTAGQASRTGWADVQWVFYLLPKWIQDHFEIGNRRLHPIQEPWCYAEIVTAAKDAPTTIQGLHSKRPWAFVDEASGVEEFIFRMLVGIFTDPDPKLVLTGNPNYNSGYFYDSFHRNRELFVGMKVSRFDVLDDLTTDEERRAFHDFIETIKTVDGEDSDEYRIRVLGDFPIQDENTVVSRYKVNQATKRYHINQTVFSFTPVVWGVDVALYGGDRSVLSKRQGPIKPEPSTLIPVSDLMSQAYWIADHWRETPSALRPRAIYIDTTGLGQGIYDRLNELGLPVHGLQSHDGAPNNDRFDKLRDELWWRAREWFQGAVWIPEEPAFIDELCTPRYTYTPQGRFRVESKHQMKARGYKSPNIADSFILTMFWNGAESEEAERERRDRGLVPKGTQAPDIGFIV